MTNTRAIGRAGEIQAKTILESLGYENIQDTTINFPYDLVAEKQGKVYHVEVKTRSNAKVFLIHRFQLEALLEAGNGLILLIRGSEYKIVKAEILEYRLKKDQTLLGISFYKNYDNLNKCTRCGKVWFSDKPNPVVCSACGSPYWNKPYKGISVE